jgi:hypothetical protein
MESLTHLLTNLWFSMNSNDRNLDCLLYRLFEFEVTFFNHSLFGLETGTHGRWSPVRGHPLNPQSCIEASYTSRCAGLKIQCFVFVLLHSETHKR